MYIIFSACTLHTTGEVVGILQRQAADVVACLTEQDEAALSGRAASRWQVQTELLMLYAVSSCVKSS